MCTQHTHTYITHSGTCMQTYTNTLQTEKVCWVSKANNLFLEKEIVASSDSAHWAEGVPEGYMWQSNRKVRAILQWQLLLTMYRTSSFCFTWCKIYLYVDVINVRMSKPIFDSPQPVTSDSNQCSIKHSAFLGHIYSIRTIRFVITMH